MDRLTRLKNVIQVVVLPIIVTLMGLYTVNGPVNKPPVPIAPPQAGEQPQPLPVPQLPQPPVTKIDPAAAVVKLRMGNVGCTGTVLEIRPGPGRYWILAAAHCVRKNATGTATLSDGRQFPFKTIRTNPIADVALLEIAAPDGLPAAQLADREPEIGVMVWHQGLGVDKPGNRESGTVTIGPNGNGQLGFHLSVSSGDSGAAIFRVDNGQIVSVVCCTDRKSTYGGGVSEIRKLLLLAAADESD